MNLKSLVINTTLLGAFLMPSAHGALIAQYDFDGDLINSVSSGAGVAHGAISYVAGVHGTALNLDNGPTSSFFYKNEWVDLEAVTLGSAFTIAHWARFDANAFTPFAGHVASSVSVGGAGGGSYRNVFNRLGGNGAAGGDDFHGGGTNSSAFFDVNDGLFHHFASVVSGDQFLHYIDGTLMEQVTMSGTVNMPSLDAFVGYSQWSGGASSSSRFDGAVDDVRFYDHALSASELEDLVGVPTPGTALLFAFALLGVHLRRR